MESKEIEAKSLYDIKQVIASLLFVQYLVMLILVGFGVYFVIPFVAILFIFLVNRELLDIIYINIFFIASCLLLMLLGKEFAFMPQAEALLEKNQSVLYWFAEKDIHAIRLLIAYPGYIFSQILDITLNKGFSYYCLIIFILLYRNLLATVKIYKRTISGYAYGAFFLLCTTLFLLYVMNGRIVFAFYGVSLIVLCNVQLYKGLQFGPKHVAMLLVGMLCTTVSSGTLIVGLLTAIMGGVFSYQGKKLFQKRWVKVLVLLLIPVAVIFLKYVLRMLIKNIDFFGGGIKGALGMLGHGLGKFIYIAGEYIAVLILLLAIIFVIFNVIFILYLYRKKAEMLPIVISLNISLYGSLFGLSTGATALIGGCLLMAVAIDFIIMVEMEKKINHVNA